MRHVKRVLMLLVTVAILAPMASAAGSSRNPNQRHAKQDYRYKVPKLKYKKPKIKGNHKAHH